MIFEKFFGKTYPPNKYVVGIEKIGEYCRATSEANPLCTDEEAAKAGPYGEIMAPPLFAVVYTAMSVGQFLFDTELDINMMMLVHGEQEFFFHKLVKHNDTVITTGKFLKAEARKQNMVLTYETQSNVDDELVTTSIYTFVIRGGAA